jgi:hypothetical protein
VKWTGSTGHRMNHVKMGPCEDDARTKSSIEARQGVWSQCTQSVNVMTKQFWRFSSSLKLHANNEPPFGEQEQNIRGPVPGVGSGSFRLLMSFKNVDRHCSYHLLGFWVYAMGEHRPICRRWQLQWKTSSRSTKTHYRAYVQNKT